MTSLVVVPESYVSPEWVSGMSMNPEQRHFNPTSTGKRLSNILKGNDTTAQKRSRFLHELGNFKSYQQNQFEKNAPILPVTQQKPSPPTTPGMRRPKQKMALTPPFTPVARRTRSQKPKLQKGRGRAFHYVSFNKDPRKRRVHIPL